MEEIEQYNSDNSEFTVEKWKSVKKYLEQQIWECENFNVDTMDDPCILSNYWGGLNEDRPGMFVIIPGDVWAILHDLTMAVGTLRREGPLCDPNMFDDEYDPTRDSPEFPIRELAQASYNLLILPTLYVIIRNVIDYILKTVKLDNYTLLDFSKTNQDAAIRAFFTALSDTGCSIGSFEVCMNLPNPHAFLLLFKRMLKI